MYSIILTELGITVFNNEIHYKAFPFVNPVKEFKLIKNECDDVIVVNNLIKNISNLRDCMINDVSLLNILKKNSISARLMNFIEINKIQLTKKNILIKSGFASNDNDAISKLRDFAFQLSSSRIVNASQDNNLHIIQAISTHDEIDRIVNIISSRVREWYGLHFPELDSMIGSVIEYSNLVFNVGKRKNLSIETCKSSGFLNSRILEILEAAKKSNGGNISDENIDIIQNLAKFVIELNNLRSSLEKHVKQQMMDIAPNMSTIVGSILGARMIAHVGSIEKLSKMPSSTIQILGAEKALFRSMKTGSKPPKHGLLFQHPLVHRAPKSIRGKIARTIAAKTAIASRVDTFGSGLNYTLLEKLNIKIDEINKNNPRHMKKINDIKRESKKNG